MTPIDLHLHSQVSDGVLSPADVVLRAVAAGCQMLALTDHDDIRGLPEARQTAEAAGLRFINGVEISVSWRGRTVHIVGLDFDAANPVLLTGLQRNQQGRGQRAMRIAEALAQAGFPQAMAGALRHAANPEIISRAHFARHLVEEGVAKDVKAVFKRFLKRGKPGYVPHQWAALADAIGWIHAAGGLAVLAHPGRYEIGRGLMLELLTEFCELGGNGLEVVTSNHDAEQVGRFAELAKRFGLLASVGSDYHGPNETWCEPGMLPDLPYNCRPIWEHFSR